VNNCLICQNNTQDSDYKSLCVGCQSLLQKPIFSCHQCGTPLQVSQHLCGSCLIKPPVFNQTFYASLYQEPVDTWVMALKFGKKIIYSRLMAELMQPALDQVNKGYVLMPVPLHKSRLRTRGYNQAYEIAKELSKYSGLKLDASLLRKKDTQMQAQLKFKERAKNVRGAFALPSDFHREKVVLVDDVMTSGNTLSECSKTLIKSGVKSVKVLVFARKSL